MILSGMQTIIGTLNLKPLLIDGEETENNEYHGLMFVENSKSFAFLYGRTNWPTILAECQFTTKNNNDPTTSSAGITLCITSDRLGVNSFKN